MKEIEVCSDQKGIYYNQTMGTRLEFTAPVALVKDVLLAYDPPNDESDTEDWDEVYSWDEYVDLGLFDIDNQKDESRKRLSLRDTHMILLAERAETENIQAILVQPVRDTDCFKRIGYFMHKPTEGESNEEDSYEDWEFEPLRKVFKSKGMVLV